MGTGIIVCGLNGAGKSTLGKALAEKLNFYFIDSEDLYFPNNCSKAAPSVYSSPRSREDAIELLFRRIREHENFVLASVTGNYGKAVYPYFQYAVLIDAPKELRLERVKKRSFEKFGNRMLPEGDLYEQEEAFFEFVQSRPDHTVEEWLQSMSCPVIRADGRESVEETIKLIIEQMRN